MAADPTFAIDLHDVTKVYRRKVHALRGVSMQVRRGEIFGLLGPNGAGKSTLVKIMMTVVRPTHASGLLLGKPVGHKATLRRVGYLPENHRFPKYLTGRQTLDFFSALAKVDRRTRRQRCAELLDAVGMNTWADVKISQYSKGMMQRIGLAQALSADPDLVVLDEPTDGVDPGGRKDIRDVLLYLRDQNKTIFINSHLLSELETVCNRVAIMVQGNIARQGTLNELSGDKQHYLIEVGNGAPAWREVALALPGVFDPEQITALANPRPSLLPPTPPPLPPKGQGSPLALLPPAMPTAKGKLASGQWCEFDGVALRVGIIEPSEIQPIIDSLRNANLIIRRVHLFRPSLEDLFFEAVTNPTTGQRLAPGAFPGGAA